jgi:hypothetical protein
MEEKGAASGMMDRPLLGRAILKLLLQLGTDKARTGAIIEYAARIRTSPRKPKISLC